MPTNWHLCLKSLFREKMTKDSAGRKLFAEKSLRELLSVYERAFPSPMPAKALGAFTFLISLFFMIVTWYLKGLSGQNLNGAAGLMATFALTVGASLMGVVIAGMSIFAASLNPNMAKSLIDTNYPNTDIPSLKFIFAMFSHMLFYLFLTICVSSGYYFFIGTTSFVAVSVHDAFGADPEQPIFKTLTTLYVSFLAGLLVLLGSLLKSFIWNLHQVLLVVSVFNSRAKD